MPSLHNSLSEDLRLFLNVTWHCWQYLNAHSIALNSLILPISSEASSFFWSFISIEAEMHLLEGPGLNPMNGLQACIHNNPTQGLEPATFK